MRLEAGAPSTSRSCSRATAATRSSPATTATSWNGASGSSIASGGAALRWPVASARLPDGVTRPAVPAPSRADGPSATSMRQTMFRADEMRRLFRPDAYRNLHGTILVTDSLGRLRTYGATGSRRLNTTTLTPTCRSTSSPRSIGRRWRIRSRRARRCSTIVSRNSPQRFRRSTGCAEAPQYLFKQAMRGILPDAIIDRPEARLRGSHRGVVPGRPRGVRAGSAASSACRDRGVFDTAQVERLLALNARGRDLVCSSGRCCRSNCGASGSWIPHRGSSRRRADSPPHQSGGRAGHDSPDGVGTCVRPSSALMPPDFPFSSAPAQPALKCGAPAPTCRWISPEYDA